jgi:hypothetical protein
VNPYLNEEVMWERLKDAQREAENRRLMRGDQPAFSLADLFRAIRELARAFYPRWWSRPETF